MAEYVKSRMTAAKVGVGLALFGLVAGVLERVRSDESNQPTLGLARPVAAVDSFLKWSDLTHKITSKQIKFHSLLLKDFKSHQVLSYKELGAIKRLNKVDRTIKGELATIKGELTNRISGNGSVISGIKIVPHHSSTQDVADDLLTVPGVLHVGAYNDDAGQYIKVENLSSSQLQLLAEGDQNNPQTLQPAGKGGAQSLSIKFTAKTMSPLSIQVFGDQQPPVTLTVSSDLLPDCTTPQTLKSHCC